MSRRSSGILLHPTSLPSPFGVGDFGEEARAFIHFLHDARQTLWQTLPLGPTGYGNSPYQALSAFAGNTLLIDPRALVDAGLLETGDVAAPMLPTVPVDFDIARSFKTKILNQAFKNFRRDASATSGWIRTMFVASRARPAYLPRTPPFMDAKSYSGRISSDGVGFVFFIEFSFAPCGGSGADDSNDIRGFGV